MRVRDTPLESYLESSSIRFEIGQSEHIIMAIILMIKIQLVL